MGTSAILMMILFSVLLWGGLIVSIVLLMRSPDESRHDEH